MYEWGCVCVCEFYGGFRSYFNNDGSSLQLIVYETIHSLFKYVIMEYIVHTIPGSVKTLLACIRYLGLYCGAQGCISESTNIDCQFTFFGSYSITIFISFTLNNYSCNFRPFIGSVRIQRHGKYGHWQIMIIKPSTARNLSVDHVPLRCRLDYHPPLSSDI